MNQNNGFVFEGKTVCRKFMANAFMVSENKIRAANGLTRNPDNPLTTPAPKLGAATPETPLKTLCETFWGKFLRSAVRRLTKLLIIFLSISQQN